MSNITQLGKDGLKIAHASLESFSGILTAVIAVFLIVGFIICLTKFKEKLNTFKSIALGIIVGYAITISACISFFMFARLSVKGEIDVNFYLVLGLLILCIIYAISALITKLVGKKAFKICNIVGFSTCIVYVVLLLFIIPTAGEEYKPLGVGIYLFTILLVLVTALLTIFFGKDNGSANSTKSLAYAGICIALSFALSYVKLFSLPQGGSITLASMLPIIIYSYIFGARKGVLAGVIYGLLQCIQSPQIYQPMQVLIDYPIAFGVLGVAGIARNMGFIKNTLVKFIIGCIIACVFRYFSHVISGYYVFSSWSMEGYTAFTWAVVYNLYVIAELGICLVVGCILFSQKSISTQFELINPKQLKENNK